MTDQQPSGQERPEGEPADGQGGPAKGWGQQPPPGQSPYGPPPPGWSQQPPAPPKRRFGRGVLVGCLSAVVLLVVLIVVIVLAVGGSSKKSPTSPSSTGSGVQSTGGAHPPEADVTVTSCDVDPTTSIPSAKLEIVNHSSKSSDYSISVEFVDANGTRVAEGAALQNHLGPGQKAEDTAGGTAQVSGKVTCRVTSVNRISAVG
ncbi:hypothetical protein CFP65_3867 [Kitasatospora sp. MMS16-BH015]|nr:hypothetical protein CFP65_3867 [Kitasatospora sp. MMS16-BH015]